MQRGSLSVTAMVWRRPRGVASSFELLLIHPGAPLFVGKDAGAWFTPTGDQEGDSRRDDDLVETALRALHDATGLMVETPALSLGQSLTADGHTLVAFAFEADDAPRKGHVPPQQRMEWPPGSGFEIAFTSVDAVAFVAESEAAVKLHPSLAVFIDRLSAALG